MAASSEDDSLLERLKRSESQLYTVLSGYRGMHEQRRVDVERITKMHQHSAALIFDAVEQSVKEARSVYLRQLEGDEERERANNIERAAKILRFEEEKISAIARASTAGDFTEVEKLLTFFTGNSTARPDTCIELDIRGPERLLMRLQHSLGTITSLGSNDLTLHTWGGSFCRTTGACQTQSLTDARENNWIVTFAIVDKPNSEEKQCRVVARSCDDIQDYPVMVVTPMIVDGNGIDLDFYQKSSQQIGTMLVIESLFNVQLVSPGSSLDANIAFVHYKK